MNKFEKKIENKKDEGDVVKEDISPELAESAIEEKEHFPLVDRLHTDVLTERYGKVEAKVIEHNEDRRIVDIVDAKGISRTHALTLFPKWTDKDQLSEIDKEIADGGLIGEVFRKYGYQIRKNVIDVFTIRLSDELKSKFDTEEDFSKARTSEFYAKKDDNQPLIYGFVTEIYPPDFREAVVNEADMQQINASTHSLEDRGISRDDIWQQIGKEKEIDRTTKEFEDAQKESLQRVHDNRRYVQDYLDSEDK